MACDVRSRSGVCDARRSSSRQHIRSFRSALRPMLESMMYFAIGFLAAAIAAIAVMPRVHERAVRLTTRRLEAALPPSIAEVQAEKDLQRAEFAMTTRRLEVAVEQLNDRHTGQLAELGRKETALGQLKMERNAQQAEIIALKIEVEALKEQLAFAGHP